MEFTGISKPSPQQLELINKYRPSGTPEYEASEITVVTMRASNNLLSKDRKAWTPQTLLKMAQSYPGKPQILDHNDSEIKDAVGFVFEAKLMSGGDPEIAMGTIHRDLNSHILSKYGYYELVLSAAIQSGTAVEEAIRYGRIKGVSTGTFGFQTYICPVCDCEIAEGDCDHIPPTWNILLMAKWGELSDRQIERIVPFVFREGADTAIENSFVSVPNLEGTFVL